MEFMESLFLSTYFFFFLFFFFSFFFVYSLGYFVYIVCSWNSLFLKLLFEDFLNIIGIHEEAFSRTCGTLLTYMFI